MSQIHEATRAGDLQNVKVLLNGNHNLICSQVRTQQTGRRFRYPTVTEARTRSGCSNRER
jgi:FAD synthase